ALFGNQPRLHVADDRLDFPSRFRVRGRSRDRREVVVGGQPNQLRVEDRGAGHEVDGDCLGVVEHDMDWDAEHMWVMCRLSGAIVLPTWRRSCPGRRALASIWSLASQRPSPSDIRWWTTTLPSSARVQGGTRGWRPPMT